MRVIRAWWRVHGVAMCFILIVAFFGAKALFHPGLWTAHDIWHQVARLYWYAEALRDGQLLPGWVMGLAHGYGYPLFIFSYHLPWLVGGPLVVAGMSVPLVLKGLFIVSFWLSGVIMYGFIYDWWRQKLPAAMSAVVYLWAPYHFLTLYVTAGIGTAFVFMLLPLVLWGILRIVRTGWSRSGLVMTSLACAGIMLSHFMTMVLLIPLLILWTGYLLWAERPQHLKQAMARRIPTLVITGCLSLGLAGFYLIPLAAYLPMIRSTETGGGFTDMYQRYFPSLKQLVYSPWNFGPIVTNAKDGEMCLQVGIVQWAGIALLLFLLIRRNNRQQYGRMIVGLLAIYTATIYLMTDYARPLWVLANRAVTLDYPFRYLVMAVMVGSAAVGMAIMLIKSNMIRIMCASCFLLIAWYTNRNHVRVNLYTDIPVADYVNAELTTNTFNEYLPKSADPTLISNPYSLLSTTSATLVSESRNTRRIHATIHTDRATHISIGQYAFPLVETLVDNRSIDPSMDKQGRITIPLDAGEHQITLQLKRTWPMLLGTGVSCITGVLIAGMWIWPTKTKKR